MLEAKFVLGAELFCLSIFYQVIILKIKKGIVDTLFSITLVLPRLFFSSFIQDYLTNLNEMKMTRKFHITGCRSNYVPTKKENNAEKQYIKVFRLLRNADEQHLWFKDIPFKSGKFSQNYVMCMNQTLTCKSLLLYVENEIKSDQM